MERFGGADEATRLATRLEEALARLIAIIEPLEADRWTQIPAADVWSIGREAEHVAEAATYHQWIIRRTIGVRVPSGRPALDRTRLAPAISPDGAVELLRRRTAESANLVLGLTAAQLALPTRPPRGRGEILADTIHGVLIGHYEAHRLAIEAKLRV